MGKARILVIEDDADIWRSLQILLERAGFDLTWAADGADGLGMFFDQHHDLVVLDISLPTMDGWSVLERIRLISTAPVLMLTARGLDTDKVRGLLEGADDYLTKPFSNAELVARVGALLRRSLPSNEESSIYDDGRLRVDMANNSCQVAKKSVNLTPTEFRLLSVLVRHSGDVLSHKQILELGWNDRSGQGRGRVKFAVLGLRRKLGWEDLETSPLEAVRGFGYRYRPPVT
jgi:DNA-binding response OmpR family regulator